MFTLFVSMALLNLLEPCGSHFEFTASAADRNQVYSGNKNKLEEEEMAKAKEGGHAMTASYLLNLLEPCGGHFEFLRSTVRSEQEEVMAKAKAKAKEERKTSLGSMGKPVAALALPTGSSLRRRTAWSGDDY